MNNLRKLVFVIAALGACIVIGGAAYAASSGALRVKAPVVKRVPAAHARSARQHSGATSQGREGESENQSESESESSAETEQGQPGEPAQGHEDPAGQNVNHECTGNCQE